MVWGGRAGARLILGGAPKPGSFASNRPLQPPRCLPHKPSSLSLLAIGNYFTPKSRIMKLRSWDQLVTRREAIPQHFFRMNNTENPFFGHALHPAVGMVTPQGTHGEESQSPGETGETFPGSARGAGGGTGINPQ